MPAAYPYPAQPDHRPAAADTFRFSAHGRRIIRYLHSTIRTMDDRQQRTLKAFRAVVLHLEQSPLKPEPPLMTAKLKSLRATIKRIEALSNQQRDATHDMHGKTEHRKRELRQTLMIPLSRFARSHFKKVGGFGRVLQVPHASESALDVAKAAIAMSNALAPHARTLVAAGADRDKLQRLRTDGGALALIAKRTESARHRRSLATSDIAAAFEKGMLTVNSLEGMVMLRYAKDDLQLELWRQARRVSARIGRPRKRRERGDDEPPVS